MVRSPLLMVVLAALLAPFGAARGSAADVAILGILGDGRRGDLERSVVGEVMGRSGLIWTFTEMPAGRAKAAVDADPKTCVASMTPRAAKANGVKWIGAYFDVGLGLYVRDGLDELPKGLEDLKGRTVGVLLNSEWTLALTGAGAIPAELADDGLNYEKLRTGRIDYWYTSLLAVDLIGRGKGGWRPRVAFTNGPVHVGFACNPAIPDMIVTRMARAIDLYRHDHPSGPSLPPGPETAVKR